MKDTLPPLWQASVLDTVTCTPAKARTKLNKVWLVVQWLSVDVALGAVCSCAMMCKLMNIRPLPWQQLFILGGTVQLIYTLDHLWDVQRMQITPVTERHIFHQQYKQSLWILAVVSAIMLGVAAVCFLPLILLYFGGTLSCLIVFYLWLVNHLPHIKGKQCFHKEICIAFIYTAGICGIPLIQASQILPVHVLLVCCFGIIAFQNLLIFSYYELEEDIQQQQRSVVQAWGIKRTKEILSCSFLVFAICFALAYFLSFSYIGKQVALTYISMSAIMLLLFCFPEYFKQNHIYRKIGDGVFLLPGVVLLYKILFF